MRWPRDWSSDVCSSDLFKREILPVTIDGEEFSDDAGIRRDTSLEKLGGLTPSFQPDDGVITAGNARQMSDGAAGLLLMTDNKAAGLNFSARARIEAPLADRGRPVSR